MERSSRQGLRAERIAASPYKRPQSSGLKKSSSGTFSTVKNIFSYALSPLFRSSSSANLTLPSTTSDLPVEVEQKSESGSEDGWNGEPPAITEHGEDEDRGEGAGAVDVFDLAAAAGRSGKDFEERAAQWRARGEIAGGRRDLARRGLEGQPVPAAIGSLASGSTPNGNANGIAGFARSTAQKRPLSAAMTTPNKSTLNGIFTPTPSFLPPASANKSAASSASSVALAAFLEAKQGSPITAEDLRVIDSLTNNIHAEAGSPRQASHEVQYGGWSAGMSPRVTRPIPGAREGLSTPVRATFASPHNTPGSTFSVGTATPLGSASKASPYRVRYLGPGMSPKRMLGQQRPGAGLKPLFQFDPTAEESEESAAKKRKVDEEEVSPASVMDVEPEQPQPRSSLSQTVSLPNLASISTSPSRIQKGKTKAEARPHPLSQSVVPTPTPDATPAPAALPDFVAKGKKRAADIMRELIEEQLAPVEAAEATGALTKEIVINPYDVPSSRTSTPAEARVFESPRKSILRASVRDTPKRGAAAKLEAHRLANGSKPSTPSPVKSASSTRTQTTTPAQKGTATGTPIPDKEKMQIDELLDVEDESTEEPSTAVAPVQAPRQPKEIKEPEPFKPYNVPVLDTPSRPIPSFASPSVSAFAPSTIASGAGQKPEEPAPKFTLPAPKPITMVEDENVDISASTSEMESSKEKYDTSKIWMSAKDTALAIAKPGLPFFTFETIQSRSKDDEDTKKAKEEALKAPVPTFTFTLSGSSRESAAPAPAPATFQWPSGNGSSKASGEWVCGTCMCKSPDSASKCVVCDEPRPRSTAPAPAPAPASASVPPAPAAMPFQWPSGSAPAKSSGEWVCGTCMCKSPDSASKCVVCEEPRPTSAGAAAAPAPAANVAPATASSVPAPAPTPFQWPTGSAPPKQSSDEWTCSTCMCKSPMSATKCVVCETPK